MKEGICVLGVDDGAFSFDSDKTCLIGVVYRGTEFVEDVQIVEVGVDGEDGTEKVLSLYEKVSNHQQLKAVLVDGISVGGFNLVDIHEVSGEIGKPVVAVTKNQPDRAGFREAMKQTGNYDEVFEKFDEPVELDLSDGSCFIQFSGCTRREAEELVRKNVVHGQVPESIRVADLVGRALNTE